MNILRVATIVFPSYEAAEEFLYFCRGYFQGTPAVAGGVEFAPPRVRVRGMMAGEAAMFAREAAKTGGQIEIQEQPCQTT